MNPRVLVHLAWAAVATAAIVADTLLRLPFDPGAVVWPLSLVAYPVAGALILIHRPGNRVGRVAAVVGVTAGVFSAADWLALTWPEAAWSPYIEVVGLPGFAVTYWGLVSLLYLFPTGEVLPGWRSRLYLGFSVVALGVVSLVGIVTIEVFSDSGIANPLYVESLDFGFAIGASLVVLGIGAVGGISSVVSRLRHSVGVERDQMKVFLVGAIAFVIIVGFALGLPESADPSADPWWTYLIVMGGFLAVPAAITAAILRYRLYDIDRLVSRTVTYALVVALLAGIFLGLVTVLSTLLPSDSNLAVAGSTLAVAALFNPLRRRLHAWVDRRFNRTRYDAQIEIDSFASRIRNSHDVEQTLSGMRETVAKTMQPSTIAIWRRSTSADVDIDPRG